MRTKKPTKVCPPSALGEKQNIPKPKLQDVFGADYWTRTSDLMRVKHAL